MKNIFLLVSLPLLLASAYATDDIMTVFKRSQGYAQLQSKNHGCSPLITKILVNSDVRPGSGTQTYLLVATNHNCKGKFRYEFMRTAALVDKSWVAEKIIISERQSDINLELEKAITNL